MPCSRWGGGLKAGIEDLWFMGCDGREGTPWREWTKEPAPFPRRRSAPSAPTQPSRLSHFAATFVETVHLPFPPSQKRSISIVLVNILKMKTVHLNDYGIDTSDGNGASKYFWYKCVDRGESQHHFRHVKARHLPPRAHPASATILQMETVHLYDSGTRASGGNGPSKRLWEIETVHIHDFNTNV